VISYLYILMSVIFNFCRLLPLQVYKLPKDRFYATYFGGDEKLGLAPDAEARDLWLKFLPPGRVLPFGCKVYFLTNLLLHFIMTKV
jgi:hypothetical protein